MRESSQERFHREGTRNGGRVRRGCAACGCALLLPAHCLFVFCAFVSICRGYAVVVYCKLLNSSTSSYDLRREWEHHFFPTLTDTAARSQLAGAFGPNPYQITLAFNGMPAGHRPDTIVIKYLPVTWVDGTLLTRRGRQKHWLSLAAPANPAEGDAPGARASPRVRFCGNHEEDAIPGGSLSASEVDSEDDEEEGSGRAPSWRRLLLIIKRQLELLLKPAAKLASLQMDAINIKRWEYKPIEDARTTVLRKRRNTANPEAAAAAGANTASEITDDMLRYPMSNPFLPESARGPGAEEEEEQKGGGPAEAPMVSHPLEPLCDLYLMLGDYPSVLAAFEYLHNKRLQNALDRTEEEEDADEDEGVSLANDRVSRGRIVDLGVDVDREEFLRFDAIEARRQAQLDEAERVKAAAQLAAHTARKKKEEALRLQRERALRIQEEEEERAEELMRMQREAKQREFDRSRMDADARARFEARAQREALDSIDKSRRAEERQRQAARRQAQRTEEMASRPPAPAAAAASKIDEEEAALLAQLEAIRRRREQAEDAAPPGFVPPVVIDLAAAEWDGVNPGQFTSIALSTLEHWFQQNIERPFPSDSATTELARETRLSLSQVRDWMNHARKTRWKPTADPNAMLDEDGMPGLMSAHDEAAADMARRVAVAQLSSTSTAPVISMKIKQRQKVATDEETGADGFVRVEGAEQLQSATATPGALPASHPSHLQLESLLNESRPSAPTSGVMSADRVAMLHAAEMAAMSSSAAASTTVSTPARAALPDKAAAALAAIAAKAANAKAEPSASPEAAAATTPAASPVAEEPVGKDSTDSKDTKEKKRSRSSSRSPSRKRSSRSKRHRSGSRSKRSRRSRRSRSRSRSRSGSVDPSVFNPFLGFPMPPWFGMPPGMFAGAEAGGMPPPGFPFMPPGMLPPMPGMPPGMPPAMMAAMVPAMTAAQTAERLRQERKNQAEPTQEEAMAELEAEKKLKAREERAAREAEKIAEKLAREMAKQVAKQAEAAQKALAAMAPPVPVPVPEPPCEPTPPSRRDREREREREPKRESFRESPPEPAYEQPREQGRDAAQQHPLYREQPRDPHGRDSRRSKRDSPYEQPPRDMLLPRDQQQQQPSLSHDFAREQQPLSHDFPLSRDFSRDQARQLYEQQQPRQSPQGYDLPYEQTVTYEPPPREREPREVKRRERSSRESRSARDPRDEAAAAAASSYPAALLGNPQFDPHASAYDPYSASLLQATRDSHAASSGSSSRRDRSSRSDTHASGLPPVPLSSGKYVQAPLSSPPSNYAAYPPQSGYPSVYLPGQSSMMPGVYDDRSSGGRERSERHHRDAAPNNMMMEADTGMMDVEAEGRGHRSKRGGKRRSKKSSQQEGAGGFPVDDATRWRGGL